MGAGARTKIEELPKLREEGDISMPLGSMNSANPGDNYSFTVFEGLLTLESLATELDAIVFGLVPANASAKEMLASDVITQMKSRIASVNNKLSVSIDKLKQIQG